MADDEFTAEEIAHFEEVLGNSEQIATLEKFAKWRGQKENRGSPSPDPQSPPSPSANGPELTLSQLEKLVANKSTRSILKHLSEAAEALDMSPPPNGSNQKPTKEKPASGLKKLLI
jgi:hypothetical protein